jgi:hypothetical protein
LRTLYYKYYTEEYEQPFPLVVKEHENSNLEAERIDPTAHGVSPITRKQFLELIESEKSEQH